MKTVSCPKTNYADYSVNSNSQEGQFQWEVAKPRETLYVFH